MKVKELITALLDEDMDDEVCVFTNDPRYSCVDGIRPANAQGTMPGVVMLDTDIELVQK